MYKTKTCPLDSDPELYHTVLLSIESLSLNSYIVLGLLIVVLLLLTALIAGSEVAYFSLSAKDINYIKQKEDPNHKSILTLLEHPKRFLATLLICNNFLSIGVIISSNMFFEAYCALISGSPTFQNPPSPS